MVLLRHYVQQPCEIPLREIQKRYEGSKSLKYNSGFDSTPISAQHGDFLLLTEELGCLSSNQLLLLKDLGLLLSVQVGQLLAHLLYFLILISSVILDLRLELVQNRGGFLQRDLTERAGYISEVVELRLMRCLGWTEEANKDICIAFDAELDSLQKASQE